MKMKANIMISNIRGRCIRQAFILLITAAVLLPGVLSAQSNYVYQLDNGVPNTVFNNSAGSETEDNWVANSFQVVSGGNILESVEFLAGVSFNNQPIDVVIYTGSSLTNPDAGGGLVRVSTTATTVTVNAGQFATLDLNSPLTLPVGQIFYAALLMPGVPGNVYPWYIDTGDLNQSFFDVGPTQGAPYDLDNTGNATVLGGSNPVVGQAQPPGDLILRVNATVPEPATWGLLAGGVGLFAAWRRRRNRMA
jgi:hypothetical protein